MLLRPNRSSACASHASWHVLPRVYADSSFWLPHFVGVCVDTRILSVCLHLRGRRWIHRRSTPFLHPIVGIEYADPFLSPLGSWAFGSGRTLHSSSSSGRSTCSGSSRRWRWRSTGILRSSAFEPVPIHSSGWHQGGLYLRSSPLGMGVNVVCRVDMLRTLGQLVLTRMPEV